MWNPTPWMVDGARHSAAVGRLVAYASLSGSEGIVTPADLKVEALASPGAAVRVAPGGAIILNRYPGGGSQSYVGLNVSSHQVSIAPTTSAGGRTDLVVARVADPEFQSGMTIPDPLNYQYVYTEVIQGVSSAVTSARELNLNYPAVALAKVTLPASTSTVTSGMITDLRKMANPRSVRRMQAISVGTPQTFSSTSLTQFPTDVSWTVDIPEWAAVHKIRADLVGVVNQNAAIDGWLAVVISTTVQQQARFDIPWAGETGRHVITVAGESPVGVSHRGGTLPVTLRAQRVGGAGSLYVDARSQVIFDIEFTEAPI